MDTATSIFERLSRGLRSALDEEDRLSANLIEALIGEDLGCLVQLFLLASMVILRQEKTDRGLFGSKLTEDTGLLFAAKYGLSSDDMRTLCLLAQGKTNEQIGEELNISVHAIDKRVRKF